MRYFLVGLAVCALVVNVMLMHRLYKSDGDWRQYQNLRIELLAEQDRQALLINENRRLSAEVTDLKGGQEILEEVARYDLGLIRDGEFFINLADAPEAAPAADSPAVFLPSRARPQR
ncbi:MAG: septum formation initiator family protein [Gammaproteobacteria bacterium]|nr:septum formation initiator family protein [Pseudomonadota bacterium]MCH9663727.1 septum formation initiator family protein [Gammaproteobacteria bacterium]